MQPASKIPPQRRRYARATGPFDGWQVGVTTVRVRIVNLGLGGCFVFADPEQQRHESRSPHLEFGHGGAESQTCLLQIDLGDEGVIDVVATMLAHRLGGTAVTFAGLSPDAAARIRRIVDAQESFGS